MSVRFIHSSIIFLTSIISLFLFSCDQETCSLFPKRYNFYTKACGTQSFANSWKKRFDDHSVITDFFSDVVRNAIDLHYQLFSWESFTIVAATFAPFIGARMVDERVQSCFYQKNGHKNINQMPSWCQNVAKYAIGIPAVFFGLQGLFSKDLEARITGQLLLVGFPFVVFGKDLLKHLNFECCLRPWNEHFSSKKRARGGCPSGHVAEATFVAALYGFRFGPACAIPLSAVAVVVGATFLNCNRHYLSQIVAGVSLGMVYAVAADKVVACRLKEYGITCNLMMDQKGCPGISIGGTF